MARASHGIRRFRAPRHGNLAAGTGSAVQGAGAGAAGRSCRSHTNRRPVATRASALHPSPAVGFCLCAMVDHAPPSSSQRSPARLLPDARSLVLAAGAGLGGRWKTPVRHPISSVSALRHDRSLQAEPRRAPTRRAQGPALPADAAQSGARARTVARSVLSSARAQPLSQGRQGGGSSRSCQSAGRLRIDRSGTGFRSEQSRQLPAVRLSHRAQRSARRARCALPAAAEGRLARGGPVRRAGRPRVA